MYDILNDKFKSVLNESQKTVKDKFKELHSLLDSKQQKLLDQLSLLTSTLEQQSKKQVSEMVSQTSSSAELWKITAKDRLLYFSQQTEKGEIPLDLLQKNEFGCVEKGNAILADLDKTIHNLESRVGNIKIKKLRVDFKKKEIEKTLDSLFTLTLQLNNFQTNQKQPLSQSNSNQSTINDSLYLNESKLK